MVRWLAMLRRSPLKLALIFCGFLYLASDLPFVILTYYCNQKSAALSSSVALRSSQIGESHRFLPTRSTQIQAIQTNKCNLSFSGSADITVLDQTSFDIYFYEAFQTWDLYQKIDALGRQSDAAWYYQLFEELIQTDPSARGHLKS